MKKQILSTLLCLLLVVGIMPTMIFAEGAPNIWDGSVATEFAGGSGIESDPYQIATGAQLAYLANIVNSGDDCKNKYYALMADIDLNNVSWTPIGNTFANALLGTSPAYSFAGNFNGENHTIRNLSIGTDASPVTADVCGLFGASSGTLENINLDSVSINCSAYTFTSGYFKGWHIGIFGSIAGYASGSIANCTVTNLGMNTDVPSNGGWLANWVGGFVGTLDENSSISNCRVSGNINDASGKGSIGGFIGELGKASSIEYCGSDVSVTSVKNASGAAVVGGFIGKGNSYTHPATLINHCYATGNASGGGYVGGFTGNLVGLNVKNCYAKGNVSNANYGSSFAGSDGGADPDYGSVENCYTTGAVADIEVNAYAFFPQTDMKRSTITNCYYNNASIPGEYETAVGKSLSEMKESSFVTDLNNGDGANGWIINANGTPYSGAELADYSDVDAAIAKIPTDISVYTETTVQALREATNAVVRGKNITEQAIVEDYAIAIEKAIAGLMKKPVTTSPETNSPQTGDTSNMVLWIAILFISGAAVTTLRITKKRKKVR